jgi:carboxyl-terminal processing protease
MEGIAAHLVPKGPIYNAEYRSGAQTAVSDMAPKKRPVYIITGKETASCAEILAAAIRESCPSLIYGEQTYGKSSIQKLYTLPNGSALVMTVGRWTTRAGADLGGKGITPDIPLDADSIKFIKRLFLRI